MKRYREFQPTGFDSKGAFLDDQQDWFVAPVSQTRDSGCLDRSNFDVVLADIGGEDNEDVEVHRFGHWGPGWFEIIIVRPDTPTADKCDEWQRALEDYAIADETHYSHLEYNAAADYWARIDVRERYEWATRYPLEDSIFSIRRDDIPSDVTGELISALAE